VTRLPGMPSILVVVALALLARASLAPAEGVYSPTRVGGDLGSATTIAHWQIQSSAKAQQSGAEISSAGIGPATGAAAAP